jgi:hypothetical protein
MNKPVDEKTLVADSETINRLMPGTPTRSLHAQRANALFKDLDKLIDNAQALAAEVDDGRSFGLLEVAKRLTDAQDGLRKMIVLLGVVL